MIYYFLPLIIFALQMSGTFQQTPESSTSTQDIHIHPVNSYELGFSEDFDKSSIATHNKIVMCAYNSWAYGRESYAKFQPEDIDPSLCTHILYRESRINNLTYELVSNNPYLDLPTGLNLYKQVTELKTKSKYGLKVILSVGGWTEGVKSFQIISSNQQARAQFISSTVDLLKEHGFDGLNIHWNWPGLEYRGGTSQDKKNLLVLLDKLKETFKIHDLQLGLTVSGDIPTIEGGYELKLASPYVDYFIILGMDFTGFWSINTGHHSALHSKSSRVQNVAATLDYFKRKEVPPSKMLLVIPFYGRTFHLNEEEAKKDDHSLGSKSTKDKAFKGEFVKDDYVLGYNEVCYDILRAGKNWTIYRDTEANVPFMRDGDKWVSFDDPTSVKAKVEFGLQMNLGGFVAWTIDTDDFTGSFCGSKEERQKVTFPLLRTINAVLSLNSSFNLPDGKSKSNIGFTIIDDEEEYSKIDPKIDPKIDSKIDIDIVVTNNITNSDSEKNSGSLFSPTTQGTFFCLIFAYLFSY